MIPQQNSPGFLQKPVHASLTLLLLAALLLAAGCESEAPAAPPAPAGTTAAPVTTPVKATIPRTTLATTPAIVLPEETVTAAGEDTSNSGPVLPAVTIASGNYHPEYIRLDATVYKTGEVIEFYLVNRGSEIKGCDYAHPVYTAYLMIPDGTRRKVAEGDSSRSYRTVMIESDPGSSTGPFSINTAGFMPGRYLIQFDCGNRVSKEFVLFAHASGIQS